MFVSSTCNEYEVVVVVVVKDLFFIFSKLYANFDQFTKLVSFFIRMVVVLVVDVEYCRRFSWFAINKGIFTFHKYIEFKSILGPWELIFIALELKKIILKADEL